MSNEKLQAIAIELGVETSTVASYLRQIEYRKTYNQRPEVKAKRAAYNKARNAKLSIVRELLNERVGV